MRPICIGSEDARRRLSERAQAVIAKKGRCLLALDGMAAAGKTTLAEALAQGPDAYVVHMDDFFLPLERQCEAERARLMANADVERFHGEVLCPLLCGGAVYRPYRPHPSPGFLPPVSIPAGWRMVVVEGAYALHDSCWDAYDLRAVMTVSEETQRARILRRNGAEKLARFVGEWIPLEQRHLRHTRAEERCDVLIRVP